MNPKQNLLALLSLGLLLILVACAGATPVAPPPEPTIAPTTLPTLAPTAIPEPANLTTLTQNFYQALNDGDLDTAMELVAADVQCRGECYFTGKDLFRAFMQSATDRGDQFELSDLKAEGDKVSYNWKAYSKAGFFQAAGTESLQFRDGLIVLMESVAQ